MDISLRVPRIRFHFLKERCRGYFERFYVNFVQESLILLLPIHKILVLNYISGRYHMKFLRESKIEVYL